VEQLNTNDQATDWTPADDEITPDDGWYDYSDCNYSLKITTGDPSPSYITIKSRDLPKKLVNLEAVADSKSPLTKYVRFISSDTTFGNNTFGDTGSGALIEGRAPFCTLGDLTWESGSSNDLTLTSDGKAVVYGRITSFDETSTTLKINDSSPDLGYYYYTDPSDPKLFDTAGGQYFDLAHLSSSYDHSSGSATFHYGEPKSISWPEINETRYSNLATTDGIYISNNSHPDESDNWYNCSLSTPGWRETYEDSGTYFYTGTGTLVVLDGNGQTSGISGEQIGIDDGGATGGNDIIEDTEWHPYPPNGLIYSPGNLRVLGIIGDDNLTPSDPDDDIDYNLAIVSGGTIYIEGNLIKGTNGSSLALLAKDWVTLNPTHTFTGGEICEMEPEYYDSTGGEIKWNFKSGASGSSRGVKLSATTSEEVYTIGVLDLGHLVLANRITLKNLTLKQDWTLKIYVSGNKEWNQDTVEANDILFGQYTEKIENTDVPLNLDYPVNFRYIKTWLHTTSSTALTPFQITTITASLAGDGGGDDGTWGDGKPLINTLCFAQRKSWAVIPGNETAYSIVIGGGIAENEQEQSSNWSSWKPYITYKYDPNLSSNLLPPSVNLVSLKRE
ncbi:MAG: hypothetical protein U9R03_00665, partial [Candidatus Aerophobetes bacterium]|nr:hypothetical protein [Candidatus Aerophobetes bacterium]